MSRRIASWPAEDVRTAVRRLGAGIGPHLRYDAMSYTKAQQIMLDVMDEVLVLRAQCKEWVCFQCQNILPGEANGSCASCGGRIIPLARLTELALRQEIKILHERIEFLQFTMQLLLDAPGDDTDD